MRRLLTAGQPTATTVFDLDRAWELHSQVSVRPESFGALLYHFGTRRLSFLKDPKLLTLVEALPEHSSARSACAAVGLSEAEVPRYQQALAALADSTMLVETAPVETAPVETMLVETMLVEGHGRARRSERE